MQVDVTRKALSQMRAHAAAALPLEARLGGTRAGTVRVDTGGSLTVTGAVSATSNVQLGSGAATQLGAVKSSGAGVNLSAHNGSLGFTSVTALGVAYLSATRDDGSSA